MRSLPSLRVLIPGSLGSPLLMTENGLLAAEIGRAFRGSLRRDGGVTTARIDELDESCFNHRRSQYDAECLLDSALRLGRTRRRAATASPPAGATAAAAATPHGHREDSDDDAQHRPLVMLITSEDCYHEPLNFVFGLARKAEVRQQLQHACTTQRAYMRALRALPKADI